MEESYSSLRQLDHHDNSPIRVYINQEPEDYPAHWHRAYEIIMPVSGPYNLMVDNDHYEVLPQEIIVIPSGVVHEIFAPTEKEILQAEAMVRAFREASAAGVGVFTVNGKMVDIAFIPGAERTLRLAKACGMYEGDLV